MDEVYKQSPPNFDKESIKTIFIKNNENVLDTLLELWDIDDKHSSIIQKDDDNDKDDKEKNKWTNIRDICDSFDIEMQKFMKK